MDYSVRLLSDNACEVNVGTAASLNLMMTIQKIVSNLIIVANDIVLRQQNVNN